MFKKDKTDDGVERRRDTKELWSFMGKTTEAIIQQGRAITSLNTTFTDHKRSEEEWQRRYDRDREAIMHAATTCPESGHIKEQNSKIDKIKVSVGEISSIMNVWKWVLSLVLPAIITMLIANYFKNSEVKPKDVHKAIMELKEELAGKRKLRNDPLD